MNRKKLESKIEKYFGNQTVRLYKVETLRLYFPFPDGSETPEDVFNVALFEESRTRVILVGSGAFDLPENIKIVAQEAIVWASGLEECQQQFQALQTRAREKKAKILFEAITGILPVVMLTTGQAADCGVIIPHMEARIEKYVFVNEDHTLDAEYLIHAVKHANPRAKTETRSYQDWSEVTVKVEHDQRIAFSHIEWF